jgi:hypothetical protein
MGRMTKALNDISFLAGFLAGRQMRRRDEDMGCVLLSSDGLTKMAALMRDTQGANLSECAGVIFGYENPDWTCPAIEQIDEEDREDYELRMAERQAGMDF